MAEAPFDDTEVLAFLRSHHAGHGDVHDLERLSGGYWSAAYAYRLDDRALVLRVGEVREGFEMDRAAVAFRRPGLPIPDVLEVGDALGRSFAISVRHRGRFLESAAADDADAVGPTLVDLLRILLAVPASAEDPVDWFQGEGTSWRGWVAERLADDPTARTGGWRPKLAADAVADTLFRRCEERIAGLLPRVPERRDLIHGDLLYGNVLVTEDFGEVTAVISWKCSVRGDFLWDLALCTFWAPWHEGIGAVRPFERLLRSLVEDPPPGSGQGLLDDAALRHHCYELAIGASHLGWYAWNGDTENQAKLVEHLTAVLERGPLPEPTAQP